MKYSSISRLLFLLQATFVLVARRQFADSISATPFTFRQTQPDGTQTFDLQMHGDENYYFVTDELGYTVVKDEQGWNVYGPIVASSRER